MMRSYAEAAACRREFILNYFGESFDPRDCRRCDNSLNVRAMPGTAPIGPYSVGTAVRHVSWGEGIVERVTADSLTVLFDAVGFKTFDLALVQERKLIELTDVGASRDASLAP